MVFTVFFSPSISPDTSTVILRLRSPSATARVTVAMSRTCAVRLPAIRFTLSVRSRQMPATPGTTAWPPSLPSVPTSRATRVTCSAKTESCSSRPLTVERSCVNSPGSGWPARSGAMRWDRSPSATAASTRLSSEVGNSRFSARAFTDSRAIAQPPVSEPVSSRCPRPAPSSARSPTRSWLRCTISFTTDAICAAVPSPTGVSLRRKLPSRTSRRTDNSRSRNASSDEDAADCLICADNEVVSTRTSLGSPLGDR